MSFRTLLALVSLTVGGLASSPSAQGATDAQAIVQRVQARYDATADFTADVVQEMTIASLNKTMTTHGTVAFKKPGRMRWEFTDGDPQIIVADGTTLWFYKPKETQVFKAPFNAAFRSATPISFLTGVGQLTTDFDVQLDGVTDDGEYLYLMLVPKKDAGDLGRVRLLITRDSADIRGAEVFDPMGNVSKLRFKNVRRNLGLSEDKFVFEIPDGVDVINAPIGQ
ncbi:MAG TPA: outer membrane lipoprotein chaperone LolA [Terriglobales bacterium]|nr:outer membrane lipoprotein chaperone LolA [Terriglobales bacterium]